MHRVAIPAFFLITLVACTEPAIAFVPPDDAGQAMGDAARIEADAWVAPGADAWVAQDDAYVAPADDAGTDAYVAPCTGVECPPDAWTPPPPTDAGSAADAGHDGGSDAGPPRDMTTVVQLALGDAHSCAMRASGQVICWGNTGVTDGTPVLTDAVDLAASGRYSFARRMDGSVVRWTGTSGPLTVVSTMPADPPMGVPTYAPGESFPLPTGDYVEVWMGLHHTCGRRSGGAVFCWGQNVLAQLGRDTGELTSTGYSFPAGEVLIAGARMHATILAVGRDHSCVALSDGRVMCWGSNSEGQLGRWVTGLQSIAPVEPYWY